MNKKELQLVKTHISASRLLCAEILLAVMRGEIEWKNMTLPLLLGECTELGKCAGIVVNQELEKLNESDT